MNGAIELNTGSGINTLMGSGGGGFLYTQTAAGQSVWFKGQPNPAAQEIVDIGPASYNVNYTNQSLVLWGCSNWYGSAFGPMGDLELSKIWRPFTNVVMSNYQADAGDRIIYYASTNAVTNRILLPPIGKIGDANLGTNAWTYQRAAGTRGPFYYTEDWYIFNEGANAVNVCTADHAPWFGYGTTNFVLPVGCSMMVFCDSHSNLMTMVTGTNYALNTNGFASLGAPNTFTAANQINGTGSSVPLTLKAGSGVVTGVLQIENASGATTGGIQASGQVSFDAGLIQSDGSGDLFVTTWTNYAQNAGADAAGKLSAVSLAISGNANIGGYFIGNGADLTSLNASALGSGTVPAACMPTATTLALGGVKVDGTTITINGSGVISSSGGGGVTAGGSLTNVSIVQPTNNTIAASNITFLSSLTNGQKNAGIDTNGNGTLASLSIGNHPMNYATNLDFLRSLTVTVTPQVGSSSWLYTGGTMTALAGANGLGGMIGLTNGGSSGNGGYDILAFTITFSSSLPSTNYAITLTPAYSAGDGSTSILDSHDFLQSNTVSAAYFYSEAALVSSGAIRHVLYTVQPFW